MKIKIRLLEPMLGTVPKDKEIYASYIGNEGGTFKMRSDFIKRRNDLSHGCAEDDEIRLLCPDGRVSGDFIADF